MANLHSKVLILGSGPAGYTAAIYAARANLSPLLVAGMQPGGQLVITTEVENYPGFADAIQGPWLMEQMRDQAEHVGTKLIQDVVTSVDLSKRPFTCVGDAGDIYTGDTLVIATGASARWLGLPNEQRFRGFGVSACATCDGFFFRDKEVAVVGGGNSAVEESLFLANMASKVTLIHRRDSLRAEKILQDRMAANPKISVRWNHAVDDFLGDANSPALKSLRLKNTRTGAASLLNVDGLFIAIGHDPNTALFKDQIDMDSEGYIVTRPGTTRTSIPGVFAAGDVQDKTYRQAVTAAGSGCMSALDADRFLAHQGLAASVAAE